MWQTQSMSDTSGSRVEVGKQGRIVIPASIRRELGIEEGTKLAVRIKDGAIELLTDDAIDVRLRAIFANAAGSEELLAERRAEAQRDAQEELSEQDRVRRP